VYGRRALARAVRSLTAEKAGVPWIRVIRITRAGARAVLEERAVFWRAPINVG
jgi:hypothetical protein